MVIEWLGHSAFLITSKGGVRILTDPYEAGSYGGALGYRPIERACDIVTVSHDHPDHSGEKNLLGSPTVVKGSGSREVRGITFKGVPTYHDACRGKERGRNVAFVFEVDGLGICHLGDLGCPLSREEAESIGRVDILLCPVGGFYTIDAAEATTVMGLLRPRVCIPMHFKTEVLGFPIEGVDKFLAGKPNIRRAQGSTLEVTKEALPKETEIVVLKHAL
jgi:L-ascorbate metabolism protein UlaG (beta-lactamase superfamily)